MYIEEIETFIKAELYTLQRPYQSPHCAGPHAVKQNM